MEMSVDTFKQMIQRMQAELASLSPADRAAPAYVEKSTQDPKLVHAGTPGAWAVVAINPAFFNQRLPNTSVQLIAVGSWPPKGSLEAYAPGDEWTAFQRDTLAEIRRTFNWKLLGHVGLRDASPVPQAHRLRETIEHWAASGRIRRPQPSRRLRRHPASKDHRRCVHIRTALLVAIMSLLLGAGVAAGAGAPVFQGDPQAVTEVKAAYQKVGAAHTWRARTTSPAGGGQETSTFEFVAPDRFHVTVVQGGKTSDMYKIGQEIWTMAGGTCRKLPIALPIRDPRDWESLGSDVTITVARGGPAMVEGTPTQTYLLDFKGPSVTSHEKLYVATGTGLPRRAELTYSGGTSTTDYYDYNAPITINNPPC